MARAGSVGASGPCRSKIRGRRCRGRRRRRSVRPFRIFAGPSGRRARASCGSRRPVQVARSHAPSRASTSSSVRKVTMLRSARFDGMASTRWMDAACSGWRSAAHPNNEWTAASRLLRVVMVFPRSRSRWSKNEATSGASRSEKSRSQGLLPVCLVTKPRRSRNVSRYPATVLGLARRWLMRRSAKKACKVGARAVIACRRSGHRDEPPRAPSAPVMPASTSTCQPGSHGRGRSTTPTSLCRRRPRRAAN